MILRASPFRCVATFMIVTSVFAAPTAAQSLPVKQAVEVFRLGGVDAPEHSAFPSEPSLVVDGHGSVFAHASPDAFITVFDAAGRFVRQIGGSGEGPGEFTMIVGYGFIGDTLWIRNWPTPRISTFLLDGTHLLTRTTPVDVERAFTGSQGITAFLVEGRSVGVPDAALVARPQGMQLAGVGYFGFAPYPIPPLISLAPGGTGLVVATWADVESAPLILTHFGASESGGSVVNVLFPRDPVPERSRDSLIAVGVETATPYVEGARRSGKDVRGSVEDLVEAGLYIPRYEPPVLRVLIGLDETVWLLRFSNDLEKRWSVHDRDGRGLFQVSLPGSLTVRQASISSLWATETGALDVPYLVRLDLRGLARPARQSQPECDVSYALII